MGLEYLYKDGEKACSREPLKVKSDGVHIGEIRKVKDGFQYFADGDKKRGVIFSSVPEVQNSLARGQVPKKDQKALEVTKDATLENMLKQAKAGLEKQEKDLTAMNLKLDTAKMLLAASRDLLGKQKEDTEEVLNLLDETVQYNDTECDGHTLLEDITGCVENL